MFTAWPFVQCGLDIVRPLKREPNNKRFLLVSTDYFTKWIKVKTLATITAQDVRWFIWDGIICRFGIPHTLVSDNEKKFNVQKISTLHSTFGIRYNFFAPYHPQENSQAMATNKTLLGILKKRLEGTGKRCAEHLPVVSWAYRTTPKYSTGLSFFYVAYEVEVVLPTKYILPRVPRV